ncbi:hypothetical protein CORC01_09636, partial [Colletotrichum orchidophilum]
VDRLVRVPTFTSLSKLGHHVFYGIAVTYLVILCVFEPFGAGMVPPAPKAALSAEDAMEAIRDYTSTSAEWRIPPLYARNW